MMVLLMVYQRSDGSPYAPSSEHRIDLMFVGLDGWIDAYQDFNDT